DSGVICVIFVSMLKFNTLLELAGLDPKGANLRRSYAIALVCRHRLFFAFAVLAVTLRLIFWIRTGRIWEDALISLTPARNVWEGFGLTHHASEPRVHSFTSALGELILIAGESVHAGLSTIRLVSILAAVAAIYYAYQIGRRLSFPWPAQVLILGYLAADHLQIFFGMAGMETQVATALVLANAHFYLSGQWRLLGFATGFAVICRPEFGLWAVIMGGVLLIWHRKAVLGFAIPAATVALPWFIFATLYYGSPVPHPVVVKSYDSPLGSMDWSQILDWPQILAYLKLWWKEVAPFRQYFAWNHSPPVSDIWLQVIVGVAAAC